MHARELRIGNLVLFNNEVVDITGMVKSGFYFGKNGFAINLLEWWQPITLTEESVLKLGFCKDNSDNNKTYLSPIHNGVVIKLYFNRFGVAKLFVGNNLELEIKHIHTLQNFYYLLTSGGELKFKTKINGSETESY